MQTARDLKSYRRQIGQALDNDFQRQAMDKFAVAYRASRANAFTGLDLDALVADIARLKDVALVGIDKLLPSLADALRINKVLPRNATGQDITSYVTWITGPNACGAADNGQKILHVVFLDNGRRELARDPDFAQVLRCVRCGACANVCPVYRMVGGHQYGNIYIGAIGLILTYFFHGRDKARNLVQNCINCGACKEACAAGIDLPQLIKAVHARVQEEEGHPLQSLLLGKLLKNRKLFHSLLLTARKVQKPITGGTPYLRHLPMIVSGQHNFRRLPAIAPRAFRDLWPGLRPRVRNPVVRVALFSGCVQDFVYPEQLVAALHVMTAQQVAVDFPLQQSCCGLPVEMMGEIDAARHVAAQNVLALAADRFDHIVTLCASCASHLTNAYPRLLADDPVLARKARRLAAKVVPFSVLMNDILQIKGYTAAGPPVATTYHAPCHLCRGLNVKKSPRELIRKAGLDFRPADEEQTCCGFGGTYSSKFPAISAQILDKKLEDAAATGARQLVTECPGCILQLRGGAQQRGLDLRVMHLSEMLWERTGKGD